MIGKVLKIIVCLAVFGAGVVNMEIAAAEDPSYWTLWTSPEDVRWFVQDAADGKIEKMLLNSTEFITQVIDETIKSMKKKEKAKESTEVSLDDKKKADLVAIIWTANVCFQDLSLSKLCLDKLQAHPLSIRNNCELAKYLIMSQCDQWEEGTAQFVKKANADKDLIAEAIWKLRVATNGAAEASKTLLTKLKTSKLFEDVLGDWQVYDSKK
jgi:hypothetical protein